MGKKGRRKSCILPTHLRVLEPNLSGRVVEHSDPSSSALASEYDGHLSLLCTAMGERDSTPSPRLAPRSRRGRNGAELFCRHCHPRLGAATTNRDTGSNRTHRDAAASPFLPTRSVEQSGEKYAEDGALPVAQTAKRSPTPKSAASRTSNTGEDGHNRWKSRPGGD